MSESHRVGANQNFSEALNYARCASLASNKAARRVQAAAQSDLTCFNSVSASLISNFPGPSMFSVLTTPSLTSME